MAHVGITIADMTGASTPLDGTEVLEIEQSSTSRKVTVGNLMTGGSVFSLSDVAADPGADRLAFWDDSDGALEWGQVSTGLSLAADGTLTTDDSQIDHDSLNNFVANEHVDHSSVSITAGTALTGGGDLTATRTLNVDETAIDHDNLSGFVANEHLDWTAASVGTIDDTNLSSNVPLLDTANTFTDDVIVSMADPSLVLIETGVTAENTTWDFRVDSEKYSARLVNDARTSAQAWLEVNRTGTTVDTVNFPNGAVSITDSLAIGGGQAISDSNNIALLDSSNTFTQSDRWGNAALVLSASIPMISLYDTNESADEGGWGIRTGDTDLRFLAIGDTTGESEWLTVTRGTGVSVSTVNFKNGAVSISDSLSVGTVQTYTPSNVSTDRSFDANSTSTAELADVVGTIIADLQTIGLFN